MAGAPLRPETFNFAIRKGGPFLMPVDPVEYVFGLLPQLEESDYSYLQGRGLALGEAYRQAMESEVLVRGIQKGSWFGDREVVFTVTGPSALVSYLEAQIIWLQFRVQVATLAKLSPERLPELLGTVTCDCEREIVLETLANIGHRPSFEIVVDSEGYFSHIRERARELIEIVEDPRRVFEAGMRAASCIEQHRIAVSAAKAAGFVVTSNVELARELGIIAGGTTGHEHTQRFFGDRAAFCAVRDRVAGEVTFLLDTYSTQRSGLPVAIAVMKETPARVFSIRFDSEDTMEDDYQLGVKTLRAAEIQAPINLGGGFNAVKTRRFESLRAELGWPSHLQRYMYGQYLVEPHVPLPTRGDVGAVYKLSESAGRATMKFSDTPAKSSAPGRPVTWRLSDAAGSTGRAMGMIGQDGESPPEGYVVLADGPSAVVSPEQLRGRKPTWSKASAALVAELTALREAQIHEARA
jgi:nicotinic acid phosphoribosyltransferase